MSENISAYEKVNSLEDFATLYQEPAQTKVRELLTSHSALFEDLNRIKDFDKEGYFESIKTITDLVAQDYFDSDDLSSLVQSFNFNPEGEEGEVARWNNDYTIDLNKRLYNRGLDGKYIYNLNHDICHEIGHSIIELIEAEEIDFPTEFFQILDEIDIKTETAYIQECIVNGEDNETVIKERMAEIFGFYLTCNKDRMKFCTERIIAIADKDLARLLNIHKDSTYNEIVEESKSNKELNDLLTRVTRIYDLLDTNLPSIRTDLKAIDFETFLEEQNNSIEEVAQQKHQEQTVNTNETTSNIAQELAPDSLKTDITSKDTGKSQGYSETSGLGQKQQRSEGFISLIGDLVKNFSDEVPNVAK